MKTKICTAEQGTQEWKEDRIGYVTGSNAYKIMTNGKKAGELSAGAKTYLRELVADRKFGFIEEQFKTFAMLRGNDLEPEARATFINDMANNGEFLTVKEIGFCKRTDLKFVGASVDGLIESENAIIEIKCRLRNAYVDRVLNGIPKKDLYQMNWNMWVTGTTKCYYICYNPDYSLKPLIEDVRRDENIIRKFEEKVDLAVHYMSLIDSEFDINIKNYIL